MAPPAAVHRQKSPKLSSSPSDLNVATFLDQIHYDDHSTWQLTAHKAPSKELKQQPA